MEEEPTKLTRRDFHEQKQQEYQLMGYKHNHNMIIKSQLGKTLQYNHRNHKMIMNDPINTESLGPTCMSRNRSAQFCGSSYGHVDIVSLKHGFNTIATFKPHNSFVLSLHLTYDDKYQFTFDNKVSITMWNVENLFEPKLIQKTNQKKLIATFTSSYKDDLLFVSVSGGFIEIYLIFPDKFELINSVNLFSNTTANYLFLDENQEFQFCCSKGGKLQKLKIDKEKLTSVVSYQTPSGSSEILSLVTNSKNIYAGNTDGEIKVWLGESIDENNKEGKIVYTKVKSLHGKGNQVRALHLTGNGRQLYTADSKGVLKCCDTFRNKFGRLSQIPRTVEFFEEGIIEIIM